MTVRKERVIELAYGHSLVSRKEHVSFGKFFDERSIRSSPNVKMKRNRRRKRNEPGIRLENRRRIKKRIGLCSEFASFLSGRVIKVRSDGRRFPSSSSMVKRSLLAEKRSAM